MFVVLLSFVLFCFVVSFGFFSRCVAAGPSPFPLLSSLFPEIAAKYRAPTEWIQLPHKAKRFTETLDNWNT
eukprot:gene11893-8178_t